MIVRPPRSTPTVTLFPYTTLYPSIRLNERSLFRQSGELKPCLIAAYYIDKPTKGDPIYIIEPITHILEREARVHVFDAVHHRFRSKERSVGTECVSRSSSRWWAYH